VSKTFAAVSPYARRIQIGAAIRELRGKTTTAEVARLAGLERSVVTKVETGERRAGLDTILKILDVLPIRQHGRDYQALQRIAREGLEHGWWQEPEFREMGARQARTADLECGAKICEYQTGMIPGLLQTEAYARHRGMVALAKGAAFDLDATVAGRMRRQQQILGPDGSEYDVVLEPQAIWRLPVPPKVMREQLLHLHTLATTAENVRIYVLPVDDRLPDGWVPRETFARYTYAGFGDFSLVAIDGATADRVVTETAEVSEYAQMLKELRGAALPVKESAAFIQQAAEALAADA
jgi:transcriptional regulator with XRE-family HTH domain